MKTVIYSLFQKKEFAKSRFFVRQAVLALNQNRNLYILVNDDDPCEEFAKFCRDLSPHVRLFWERRNLGVAGGRNFLIRKALEDGFEFFVSCDNDLIFEREYFDRLEKTYERVCSRDRDVGLVQPLLLDGRKLRNLLGISEGSDWSDLENTLHGENRISKISWSGLIEKASVDDLKAFVYHTGITNPWSAHFSGNALISEVDDEWICRQLREKFGYKEDTLRHNETLLETHLRSGRSVPVYTTAGGITAFGRNVVSKVGGYNEKFNPFGYEDSEYGFRVTQSGFTNYLLTDVVAIHDPFMGENNRELWTHSTIGRLRGIEVNSQELGPLQKNYIYGRSLISAWLDFARRFRREKVNDNRKIIEFIFNYLLNFVFGKFGNFSDYSIDSSEQSLLDQLFAKIDGAALDVLNIPLGGNVRLYSPEFNCGIRTLDSGERIFSARAHNCRVEDVSNNSIRHAPYFDAYLIVKELPSHKCEFRLNVQADRHTWSIDAVLDIQDNLHSGLRIPPRLHTYRVFQNSYDVGSFSREEIYPQPDFASVDDWLRMYRELLERLKETKIELLVSLARQFHEYLVGGVEQASLAIFKERDVDRRKKILVFTDSRGQHKPAGQAHKIFGELLEADERFDVDLFLCPMKWTTTLDFLELFPDEKLAEYDAVILWTGIVDWSPRPASSAINDLYNNPNSLNIDNVRLNTRDYSKKVINNKKNQFDKIFGEDALRQYYANPTEVVYADEKTINMYSLDMAEKHLIPRLRKIRNLIYITANRFVPGWEGDFKKGRPKNISISHDYSDLFARALAETATVIDLRSWNNDQIKRYTCDNIHITKAGSDYIYEKLMSALGIEPLNSIGKESELEVGTPERIDELQKEKILESIGNRQYLATLIIGVRLKPEDEYRSRNLNFLLRWLEYYYRDLFDILIVEQDDRPRLDIEELRIGNNVRYEFIYNPHEYNRGWGYNVAVKNFCERAEVVVLMDTDVLTGQNFVREVLDCHSKYDAISPYRNIYYTLKGEAEEIYDSMSVAHLINPPRVKNPVTVAGGILIVKKDVFLNLKGFEQYTGYSCEDRAMDVTLLNHVPEERIRIAPFIYVHLYHHHDSRDSDRINQQLDHLNSNFGCKFDKSLSPRDFIHKNCVHVEAAITSKMMLARARYFGDRDLYRKGMELSVNGLPVTTSRYSRDSVGATAVYPLIESLDGYQEREIYDKAPDPDTEELSMFYNAFKGERCFIIGNGPSLNKHDLSLLEDEYTFGVNSFYYKTRETGFRPFFYVVEDSSVMKENIEEIKSYYAPFKFFPTNYKALHPKQPNTFFFRMNRGFYEKTSPNYVVPRFSTDASDVLYCGQSVTYINLQLAYFMGFEEVYLIGMDFDYVIPESHSRKGDVLLSDTDDPNHFHKDYFGKGKTWKDPKLDRVALNYKMAKLVFEATGRKVYNATIGGKLEIFDRVDYVSLFQHRSAVKQIRVPFSLAEANERYREEDYPAALAGYVQLARKHPAFQMYKRNAVAAYRKAVKNGQYCNPADAKYAKNIDGV